VTKKSAPADEVLPYDGLMDAFEDIQAYDKMCSIETGVALLNAQASDASKSATAYARSGEETSSSSGAAQPAAPSFQPPESPSGGSAASGGASPTSKHSPRK
jgi:hypothetical protein